MALTPEQEAEKLRLEIEIEEEELALAESDTSPPVTAAPTPSVTASALGGAQTGFTLGFADEIAGAAGALGYATEAGTLEGMAENYRQARDEERARQKELESANPKAYLSGALVGSLPTAVVGGSLPALAGVGAVTGLGSAEGSAWEQAKSTVLGGALGGAVKVGGDVVGSLAGKSIDALKPLYETIKSKVGVEAAQKWLETQAGKMAEKAAGLERTLGQRAALEKQLARGKVQEGDVGKLLLEKDIVTATDSSKSIAQKAFNARKEAGDELGKIVAETPNITPDQISQRLTQRANALEDVGANQDLKKELADLAKKYESTEPVSAKTIQELKVEAGNAADWQSPMRDPQAALNRELDTALKESMSPEQLASYTKANAEAAMLIPASEAAAKQSAADMGKKVLSVGAAPAIGLGYGAFQGDPLAGLAAGAGFRLAQTRGPQVLASGMWNTAKMIQKAPDRLKGVLQSAIERGEKSFAATHFLLQQTDPEYSKAISEEE
jgi:hypothetical protein